MESVNWADARQVPCKCGHPSCRGFRLRAHCIEPEPVDIHLGEVTTLTILPGVEDALDEPEPA